MSAKRNKPVRVLLIKNNTDSFDSSYGAHENYLMARHLDGRELFLPYIADQLMPFLATRQLLVGAGKVLPTARGTVYCLSQRAEHMFYTTGTETTEARGMITSRDEDLADSAKYRRLHLICGDANMSETTNMLKVGSTDLILRMVEAGETFTDLELRNPVADMRRLSLDITGRTPLLLYGGRESTALQVQQEILKRVVRFAKAQGVAADPSVATVIALWKRTLHAIEIGDPTLIERDIDWAIKLAAIRNVQKKFPGMQLSDPRIAQLDVAYHDISRSRGVYYRLEQSGWVSRFTTDLDTFRAKSYAPDTTRARVRGDFIKRARASGMEYYADWDCVRLLNSAYAKHELVDPLLTSHAGVARDLRQLEKRRPPELHRPSRSWVPAAPRI